MNREIKFRGIEFGGDKWVYGDLCTHYEGEPDSVYIIDEDCVYTRVNPESVGQFTDVPYKDGKESCQGDIFEATGIAGDKFNRVIKWENGGFWIVSLSGEARFPLTFCITGYIKGTYIGNIHQNIDLLNQ